MFFKKKLYLILSLISILFLITNPAFAEDNVLSDGTSNNNLPTSYDLRNVNGKNYITPVKNQGLFGTCWAHAALSSAESNLMLKGAPEQDLSEKALAWYTYQRQGPVNAPDDELEGVMETSYRIYNQPLGFQEESNVYDTGGRPRTAQFQMATWLGASTEEQIPYSNSNGDMVEDNNQMIASVTGDWALDYYDIYENAYHLQNSELVEGPSAGRTVESYVPKVKELILKHGALATNYFGESEASENNYFNAKTSAQYIPAGSNILANHGATVVGWDDNYSANNFLITPPGNGAWILKNSWGPAFGENGYFYLSYYDSSILSFVSHDVESPELGYSYDYNYQYDFVGGKPPIISDYFKEEITTLSNLENSLLSDAYSFANVFTSKGNENLEAVSVATMSGNAEVTAKVYLLDNDYTSPVDGQLVGTATATYNNEGFYTLDLAEPIALKPGQKFSVVENIVYTVTVNNQFKKIPLYSLEYGLEDPIVSPLKDFLGQVVGTTAQVFDVYVGEGESYVYGVSDDITNPSTTWSDVTNPATYKNLSKVENYELDGETDSNTIIPGNCMIKAYTTENDPDAVLSTGIKFQPGTIYLSTDIMETNTATTSASIIPSNATGGITYSVYPEEVASVTQNGDNVTVTAISEGYAKLVASTSNGYVATKDIIVSNNQFVVDGVTVNNESQDYLKIQVNDCILNPALNVSGDVKSVSVFVWSADDMSDVQSLPATQINGTNDWITPTFGINNTESYLLNADKIKYIIYISDGRNGLGNMVFNGFTSWVQPGVLEQKEVSYITYNQNIGFVEPTIHEGECGIINNPDSVHMEGLRVSSGTPGVNVITSAYATDYGWIPATADGTYCGTMHQNRALEAIKLNLETTLNNTHLTYRVYIKDQGWTDWVNDGEVAGTAGQGLPIQAVEIKIDQDMPDIWQDYL